MIERLTIVLLTLAFLAGCGSRPVRQPQIVVDTHSNLILGMQAYRNSNCMEARNFFSRALGEYRSVDDAGGELNALIDLADSALCQGDYAAAHIYLQEAGTITAHTRFAIREARIALLDTYVNLEAGHYHRAAKGLDGLLTNPATPADVRQAALFGRTQAAFDLNSADAGRWLDKLSISLGHHAGARSTARYQRLQARAAQVRGDTEQAVTLYRSALTIYHKAYDRTGIASTLEAWSTVLMTQGHWGAARARLRRALTVRLSMYDRTHAIADLERLSMVDTRLGDAAAVARAAQLATYLKRGGNPAHLPNRYP